MWREYIIKMNTANKRWRENKQKKISNKIKTVKNNNSKAKQGVQEIKLARSKIRRIDE